MIAVIRYGAGNIRSVLSALRRLGHDAVITDDKSVIENADKVIFPGVGAAPSAMASLEEHGLVDTIRNLKVPFLGICLGMQLMCAFSEEGDVECIGAIPSRVMRFPEGRGDKIPHMGWNDLQVLNPCAMTEDMEKDPYVYFVHSYHKSPADSPDVIATADYGQAVPAICGRDNVLGFQFHPEKSGPVGARLLQNVIAYVQEKG